MGTKKQAVKKAENRKMPQTLCARLILHILEKGTLDRKTIRDLLKSENFSVKEIAYALKQLSKDGWIALKGSSYSPKQLIEIVKRDEITEENPDFACIIKQQERLKADMLEYIARNGDTKMTKIIRKSLYDYKHLKKESPNINLRAHNESSGPKPNKKKRKK